MVLFHDTHGQTAAMIPDFLRTLKRQGKSVVSIVPRRWNDANAAGPERLGQGRQLTRPYLPRKRNGDRDLSIGPPFGAGQCHKLGLVRSRGLEPPQRLSY